MYNSTGYLTGRFGIHPTLGQLCPRKVPPSSYNEDGFLQRRQTVAARPNGKLAAQSSLWGFWILTVLGQNCLKLKLNTFAIHKMFIERQVNFPVLRTISTNPGLITMTTHMFY